MRVGVTGRPSSGHIGFRAGSNEHPSGGLTVCVVPPRYRPGPDDVRRAALARHRDLLLLCAVQEVPSGPALPAQAGADLLLAGLQCGR